MTQEDLIRIVNVFKNDGVDVETGRKFRENEIYDLELKNLRVIY